MSAAPRSMFAFWMGGISASMSTPPAAGFRGLFALWLGGGSTDGGTPPVTVVDEWIIKARRRTRR